VQRFTRVRWGVLLDCSLFANKLSGRGEQKTISEWHIRADATIVNGSGYPKNTIEILWVIP
jgi:hypothetical protein